MRDKVADAKRTFIAVTVLSGVFFGLPFLYLVWEVLRGPYGSSSLRLWQSGGPFDYVTIDTTLAAFLLGIATFVPPLLAYLDLDKKRSAAKESPKAETSVDHLDRQRSAIAQPPKAEPGPDNVYTREPHIITRAQIQESLDFLKGFLLKLLNHIRQLMK